VVEAVPWLRSSSG